jgi:hypothetical protein
MTAHCVTEEDIKLLHAVADWYDSGPLYGKQFGEGFARVAKALRAVLVAVSQPPKSDGSDAIGLARQFHETYERLAPSFGYETREASAKPWADVPDQNKQLMIAVCEEILSAKPEGGQ